MRMTERLPQKYQEVARALIPYTPSGASGQMALITVDPALPCFICSRPATIALITPAPDQSPGAGTPWLTFPICSACEERQVKSQSTESE
jgi:hypothetical protein